MMKFAHLADVHLGAWRDPRLREANTKAFLKAVDTCISEQVNFIVVSGDLFNTALPAMDCLKIGVQRLRELKEKNIPVYVVAGSHDFSASGKTMLDVLEEAGLVINVSKYDLIDNKIKLKFVVDEKTGTKLTGLPGKKGGLEKHQYEDLITEHLEAEQGQKIFLFHSTIKELMPKDFELIESISINSLPKGFGYYAGGHIHIIESKSFENHKNVVYPGPLFPNNFSELEKLGCGSFVIVEDNNPRFIKLEDHRVISIEVDVADKMPAQVQQILSAELENKKLDNSIVLLRISGKLNGRPSEIDFKSLTDSCYSKGAYVVLRNTRKLESPEFEEIKVSSKSIDELEKQLINEQAGKSQKFSKDEEAKLIADLIQVLSSEKNEAEKTADFENRIIEDADKEIGV